MSEEKHEAFEEGINNSSAFQGDRNDQKLPQIKKVHIDFRNLRFVVSENTKSLLEECSKLAEISLREAIQFFTEWGSLLYLQYKGNIQKRVQELRKELEKREQQKQDRDVKEE